MMGLGKEYLSTVIKRLKYYKDLGEKTFEQLDEKDFHFIPSPESNNIAIIVQHLTGNMLSRFTNFLTEDGEKEWRQRDNEFEIHSVSKTQLTETWNKGWDCCLQALESLTENDLLTIVYIRKEPLTVIDAVNRQLAHYAYHIGQIVYIGRMIKDKEWINLSIPKGTSQQYNDGGQVKDPANKF
jgi:hypothetical protein